MKIPFLTLALLSFSAGALSTPLAPSQPQAPGYYRMALGDWQVTAVSDGTVTVPFDTLLTGISPRRCVNGWPMPACP